MIRFVLRCTHDHEFEGWFRDNAAFDRQSELGLLACPTCGDSTVTKAIMSPAIARTDRQLQPAQEPAPSAGAAPAAPAPVAMVPEHIAKLHAMFRAVREHVERNCEDVGERFPEEARKIHYGEVEKRGIFGEATREDVKELLEEGIEIHPLPTLPKLQG